MDKIAKFYADARERALKLSEEFYTLAKSAEKNHRVFVEAAGYNVEAKRWRLDLIYGVLCLSELLLFGITLSAIAAIWGSFPNAKETFWILLAYFFTQIYWWTYSMDEKTTANTSACFAAVCALSFVYFTSVYGLDKWPVILWSAVSGFVSILRCADAIMGRKSFDEWYRANRDGRNKNIVLSSECKTSADEAREYSQQLRLVSELCFESDPSLSTVSVLRQWEKNLERLEKDLDLKKSCL